VSAEKRVKLRGVLAHTASWAIVGDDGGLVIELYDFSTEAHTWLGNDVAFLLHLSAGDKDRVLARLLLQAQATRTPDGDALLLKLIEERFDDYYAVQQWLNEQGIPFRKEFEPWA
jgi:hypothetical protein